MTTDQAEALVEQLLEAGVAAEVMDGYSGRAMFGERTTAVTLGRPLGRPLGMAAAGVAAVLSGMRAEEALRLRCDDFGLGEVIC